MAVESGGRSFQSRSLKSPDPLDLGATRSESNRIQVRRPLPRAAADERLVLYQQGFGHDGAYSARAHEVGNGGRQVDGEYEQVNHQPER
jgi:hypothetical protein